MYTPTSSSVKNPKMREKTSFKKVYRFRLKKVRENIYTQEDIEHDYTKQ